MVALLAVVLVRSVVCALTDGQSISIESDAGATGILNSEVRFLFLFAPLFAKMKEIELELEEDRCIHQLTYVQVLLPRRVRFWFTWKWRWTSQRQRSGSVPVRAAGRPSLSS